MPFDNFQIAERCDELESLLKVVNYQLSFNVMKHSMEFGRLLFNFIVDGMQNVKRVQDDLTDIKGYSSESKASLLLIKEKIVKT